MTHGLVEQRQPRQKPGSGQHQTDPLSSQTGSQGNRMGMGIQIASTLEEIQRENGMIRIVAGRSVISVNLVITISASFGYGKIVMINMVNQILKYYVE